MLQSCNSMLQYTNHHKISKFKNNDKLHYTLTLNLNIVLLNEIETKYDCILFK